MKTLKKGYVLSFGKNAFKEKRYRMNKFTGEEDQKEFIKVLVADDHPHLLAGVKKDLNEAGNIRVVGVASSYEETLTKVKELKPDIVLLDLRMPGADKYDFHCFISELRASCRCKVIIFTNETGWARIYRCLEFGASGYIEKAISFGKLANFIRNVYEGTELVTYTADKLPEIDFSERQNVILHYVADGKENNEIAEMLGLDIKTIQSYLGVIKDKIGKTFQIHPLRPRALAVIASKLGFGTKLN